MAIRTVVTAGFGNGTFNGTIKDVTLRGYSIGVAIIITALLDVEVVDAAVYLLSQSDDSVLDIGMSDASRSLP
jgi:hypothetical protein